jgi:hypothetical protein
MSTAGGLFRSLMGPDRTAGDLAIGFAGVSAATVSATFAAYMIAAAPRGPDPKASGEFGIFAAFDHRPRYRRLAPQQDALASSPEASPPESTPQPFAGPVDYTPTGSIDPRSSASNAAAGLGRGEQARAILQDFSVRDVFDGKALVETRNQLRLVKPGSELEGAGTVLSIRKGEKGWAVETSGGTIE